MRVDLITAVLVLAAAMPAAAASRVEVQDGLITAAFDATPVPEALDAVRRATGIEIVAPASVQGKQVTLAVERLPFEQFVRRLLAALDVGGFALVYEPGGAAGRVIVVDRSSGAPPPPPPAAPAEVEAPQVGAGLGPVYIPPREPPVYIPPREPPVYIPPATPPVYIPPATEPVYVPPATEPVYVGPAR